MRRLYQVSLVILAGAAIVGGGPLCIIPINPVFGSAFTTWKKQQDDLEGKESIMDTSLLTVKT